MILTLLVSAFFAFSVLVRAYYCYSCCIIRIYPLTNISYKYTLHHTCIKHIYPLTNTSYIIHIIHIPLTNTSYIIHIIHIPLKNTKAHIRGLKTHCNGVNSITVHSEIKGDTYTCKRNKVFRKLNLKEYLSKYIIIFWLTSKKTRPITLNTGCSAKYSNNLPQVTDLFIVLT